jgi:hypothetical protein
VHSTNFGKVKWALPVRGGDQDEEKKEQKAFPLIYSHVINFIITVYYEIIPSRYKIVLR